MAAGGVPADDGFDYGNDENIYRALLAMADALTTVKNYLNFFVSNLWENMINEDFIYLKQSALDALGPEESIEPTTQKLTINRLLNIIIWRCRHPRELLDSISGGIVRERIINNHLSADILDFENKVLSGFMDWIDKIKKLDPRKWPFKKVIEIVLKGLKAANTILDSLKRVWSQLEVVDEFKKHLENLVA